MDIVTMERLLGTRMRSIDKRTGWVSKEARFSCRRVGQKVEL